MSHDASIVTMELERRVIQQRRSTSLSNPMAPLPLEPISDLRWVVSPLTVQWKAPSRSVQSYRIRIQQDGMNLPLITTYRPIYSLSHVKSGSRCVVSVAAVYNNGTSVEVSTPLFWAPPEGFSLFSSQLLLKFGLTVETTFEYIFYGSLRRIGAHPNRWKWMMMVAGAWNWIGGDSFSRIQGSWLGWNWDQRGTTLLRTDGEKMGWLTLAIQYLDSLLFQAPPIVIISSARANVLKSRGKWPLWEQLVVEWYGRPFSVDPDILTTWNEVSGSAYEIAIDEMIATRASMGSTEDTNVWFWSSSSSLPWVWLAMEWCRCSSMSAENQLYLMMDLLHGCEIAQTLISQWPLRDSPMTWIRRYRDNLMIPLRGGTSVLGANWSSDTMNTQTTYLSPTTVYASIFGMVMTKWGPDVFSPTNVSYRFLQGATPFSDSSVQQSLYGTFIKPDGTIIRYTSWSQFVAAAALSDIQRGEGIAPAREASLLMGKRMMSTSIYRIRTQPQADVPPPLPSTSSTSSTTSSTSTSTSSTTSTTSIPPSTVPYTMSVQYLSSPPPAAIQALITQAITMIQSIITQSHGKRLPSVSMEYDMIVDIDIQAMDRSILASARPTVVNTTSVPMMPLRQQVTLNSSSFAAVTTGTAKLNDKTVSSLIPILIHEMLHGMGIASFVYGSRVIGWDAMLDDTKTWYIGRGGTSTAVQAYQALVGPQVQRIPVENSFGSGTAYSHWEEGLKDGFIAERRLYDYGQGPVYHPALPYEIMSGIAGSVYYFSTITAGALQDRGYVVNLSSPFLMDYPKMLLL